MYFIEAKLFRCEAAHPRGRARVSVSITRNLRSILSDQRVKDLVLSESLDIFRYLICVYIKRMMDINQTYEVSNSHETLDRRKFFMWAKLKSEIFSRDALRFEIRLS